MTKDTHTDNEEPSKGKCPYYNDDCPKCYPTKSSGELEDGIEQYILWQLVYLKRQLKVETSEARNRAIESQATMMAAEIAKRYTTQTTKLPRPTDKLCFQCGGTLYQFDDRLQCVAPGCGSYQYIEREHKIGEDGERN